jgi:tRNA A37 threonylcarbamoyladenosine synthetase subunit TsaC/SUA5/YrdC
MDSDSLSVTGARHTGHCCTGSRRLLIDSTTDVDYAARAIAMGAVTATAFGNFYVIVARPSVETVRRINVIKGRPIDQVGSITTEASRIPAMFDWSLLPGRIAADRVLGMMDALYGLGPFGFRGPAATHVPDHLTQLDRGIRTTQVIAPGTRCPSNTLFARAVAEVGAPLLYITSANRSRHLTGAVEEPAHWQVVGLAADFTHVHDLVIIEHRDETAARAAYPAFAATSVTLLSFHAPGAAPGGRSVLTIDRHGSLPIGEVGRVVERFGFDVKLGPHARRRLQVRDYAPAVAT